MKTHYFCTGVLRSVNGYAERGDVWRPAIGGDFVRCIPFDCEEVPYGATFAFISDHPEAGRGLIMREVFNSNILGRFAFFRPPVTSQEAQP